MKTNKQKIQWLTGVGLLSALVIVLQFVSMALRFSTFSITLTLIPIVVGAALYGVGAGAWLGLIFGLAVLFTGDAAGFMVWSVHGTIITVLAKGILAGLVSGLVFKLLEKVNRALATVVAAVLCPIVNSGVFFLGCVTFFMKHIDGAAAMTKYAGNTAAYIIMVYIGFNFILEFAINVVFSPTIVYIVNIGKKYFSRKSGA